MPTNKDLVKAQNGYPAQNYNPNTGAYEEAHSENNTPFVQDKDAHTRLDAIEAALGGTLNTQLTGRIVEENNSLHINQLTRMVYPVGNLTQLNIPTYDGSGQAVHPSVVHIPAKFNGYRFWMAFTPFPNKDETKENPSIVASNDGINWEVPAGVTNPLEAAPTTGYYADTSLIYIGDSGNTPKLRIYWWHFGVTPQKRYMIESSDGITWTTITECTPDTYTNLPAETDDYADGVYMAWGRDGEKHEFVRTFSNDGINFSQKAFSMPTHSLGRIGHLIVRNENGRGYHMVYAGSSTKNRDQGMSLYYGFSEDGSVFTFDPVPIVTPKEGEFYERSLYTGCMVHAYDDTYYVYASGYSHDESIWTGVIPVRIGNSERFKQQQSHVVLFDRTQVRSTSWVGQTYNAYLPQWNKYSNHTINYRNRHDQPIKLQMIQEHSYANAKLVEFELQSGEYLQHTITKADIPEFEGRFAGNIYFRVQATSAAPTAGDLTMEVTMWND